jgi:dipeptidyl aminopeptidase/acylaminoacyl peptidase
MRIPRHLAQTWAVAIVICGLYPAHYSKQVPENNSFTLEQVLSSPFPTDLIAAPTGERISWVFNAQGKRNIWVAEFNQSKARQLTHYNEDSGQEITNLEFSHDGKWIVYVRGGNTNSAGEYPNPTSAPSGTRQEIHAVSFDTGRFIRLAEGNSPVVSPSGNRIVYQKDEQLWIVQIGTIPRPRQFFSARGSIVSPAWSPDGRRLAFTSLRGDHSFIGIYDTEKNSIKYISPTVDRDSHPRWSPDGKQIAFIRQPTRGLKPRINFRDVPEPWSIMIADLSTDKVSEVWRSGDKASDSIPNLAGQNILRWGADNHLVFSSEMDGWLHLYSISLVRAVTRKVVGTVGGQPKLLTPGQCEYEQMAMTPDLKEIIYSSNCGDINKRQLRRVSISGTSPASELTSEEEIAWSPVITGSGKSLVYLKSDAQYPAMLLRHSTGDGSKPSPIAAEVLPKDFPALKLVKPRPVTFKAADGLSIHGQLFLPARSREGEKLAAVIFMHGGPVRQMFLGWHNRYYYHNSYAFNQYLANRGYAVLSVNFRLGIGYGRAFRVVTEGGGRGAAEYQDIVAAARYLRSRNDIDPTKIGLWGGSYGGYLTALGLARNSDLFAAGVDIHGVHDWSVRISGSNWIEYGDRDAVKIARESSPVGSIEKWRSPVLLIHGDDDRNVAFSQTTDLVRQLREQKVVFEQIVYPDEVHDFLLHRHWLEIFKASADFFDRHLKNNLAVR